MIVFGTPISDNVEHACVARMLSGERFCSSDIEDLARRFGVPNGASRPVAYRFADRLIQRLRKDHMIRRVGKGWEKI